MIGRLLALTFLAFVLAVPAPATADGTCSDEIEGRTYSDCPPPELLDGKTRRQQSEILKQWQTLPPDVKAAYREYVQCKHALEDAEKKLASAKPRQTDDEAAYKQAVIDLKTVLLSYFNRLAFQTGIIAIDGITDAYILTGGLRESIDQGTKSAGAADEGTKAQANDSVKRASRSQQAVTDLERELSQAELKRDLAKADRDLAATRSGQQPSSGAGSTPAPSDQAGGTPPGTPANQQEARAPPGQSPGSAGSAPAGPEGARAPPPDALPATPPRPPIEPPPRALVEGAGDLQEPWLVREGEGTYPASARRAGPGTPMELDPSKGPYVYVVHADGSISYAPQGGRNTGIPEVKHTDLAQNGAARVAGEIHFDPATNTWRMDTQSGRYSLEKIPNTIFTVPSRTRANLDAAVELARRTGTPNNIQPDYIDKWLKQ